jgi:hypothetical protein
MRRLFIIEYRDFGLFWAGTFLVNIAVQIQTIAVGWQVYQRNIITHLYGL